MREINLQQTNKQKIWKIKQMKFQNCFKKTIKKQQILLECAAKIGSKEWAEAVKELWQRMEEIEKKK